MTLREAVGLIWPRIQKLFDPDEEKRYHAFLGRFVVCATSAWIGAYDQRTMRALTVFADAPLRDVRTEIGQLYDTLCPAEEVSP